MITNAITHYQTSFQAKARENQHKPLKIIQKFVYEWLKNKEKDPICIRDKNNFFNKCAWNELKGTCSSVKTNKVYDDNDYVAWAMRYTHSDSDMGPERFWYVDIGVTQEKEIATFYTRISYARNQYATKLNYPVPPANTPRFIRNIVSSESGLKVFSRNEAFLLLDKPIKIVAGCGKALSDWIQSKDRIYPILVINPQSKAEEKEAWKLAQQLTGKCQVIALDEDPELALEIQHYLTYDLRIPRGRLRVFYPLDPNYPKSTRHRWFDLSKEEYSEERQGLVTNLLRTYSLKENTAVTDIYEIGRRISFIRIKKRLTENSIDQNDMIEFQKMWDQREQEHENKLQDLEAESSHWMTELESSKTENFELKSKLKSITSSLPQKEFKDELSEKLFTLLRSQISDLLSVVNVCKCYYYPKLIFADEAIKSAKSYSKCNVIPKAWDMFKHLAVTLYDLLFIKSYSGDLASAFESISGFEYAMTEGKQSKYDAAIRRSRLINVGGVSYEIWPHIKYGNKPTKMLRIHFAIDNHKKRLIIGYVGEHMENRTSKSIN